MPGEDRPHTPFDEQAAAKELERLHQAVEESRRRRKKASDAFDDFVSSFREEPGSTADPDAPRPDARRVPTRLNHPAIPAALTSPPRKRLPPARVLAGAVVAIAAGAMLTRVWRGSSSEQPASPPASVQAPAAALPAREAPAGRTVAAGAGMQAELVAIRDVWVRATADGVKLVERELRADERVPLRASRSIVIRAGDAGAVKLLLDGEDRGALGPDGIVVTRTFTASAPAGR